MRFAIISTLLAALLFPAAQAATVSDLRADAPDRYVVVPGDTLWGISGRFLKDPWRWPELWKANQQIRNPHLIYPGDVLVLDRSGSEVALRLQQDRTTVIKPEVRVENLPSAAIPVIPLKDIQPFLSRPLVVTDREINASPRVVALQENRNALGRGDRAYITGITREQGEYWRFYRKGPALTDPASPDALGFVGTYLGAGRVLEFGDVSTLLITEGTQEVLLGDFVVPVPKQEAYSNFFPRPPTQKVSGYVINAYAYQNISEVSWLSIIGLSRGTQDGLEPGMVVALRRNPAARDPLRARPLYGRQGLSGDPSPVPYRTAPLVTRDAPVYGYYGPFGGGTADPRVEVPLKDLPVTRYGLAMIVRAFDRVSFAIVLEATDSIHLNDLIGNP
jgi:LysM domain